MWSKFILALAISVALGPPSALARNSASPQARRQVQGAQKLDRLLAPIALYPDPLLADVLMASTHPLQVVKAARWLNEGDHPSLKGENLAEALKARDWDPSVKALAAVPEALRMMDARLDWTEQLGEAFKADPSSVLAAVQRLRERAHGAGALASAPQASVSFEGDDIAISAPDRQTVAIPACGPSVYGAWPAGGAPFDFSGLFPGAAAGAFGCGWIADPVVAPLWGWSHVNWRRRQIDIDRDRIAKLGGNRPPVSRVWRPEPAHRPHAIGRSPEDQGSSVDHALRALRAHPGAVAADPARGLRGRFRPAMRVAPIAAPAVAAPHVAAPHFAAPRIAAPVIVAPHVAAPPHIAPPAIHVRP
jgi:hypothetical protein